MMSLSARIRWPHAYFWCFQVAMNVYELSSAAGLPCEIDPALVVALSSQKSGEILLQLCILLNLIFSSVSGFFFNMLSVFEAMHDA